jgi:hypothetical protein
MNEIYVKLFILINGVHIMCFFAFKVCKKNILEFGLNFYFRLILFSKVIVLGFLKS